MDAKELQAWKRLAKKLSSLRATLRADERKILDQLIVGAGSEVELHSMTPAIQPRKTPAAQPRKTPRKTPKGAEEPSEVEMHSLTPTGQKTPQVTPRLTPRLDITMLLTPDGEYSVEQIQP
jgi:hypothetical protein